MKKPVIRTLFVDFGNVCALHDFRHFTQNFGRVIGRSEVEVRAVLCDATGKGYSPMFMAFECGEIGPVGFFHALTHALDCAKRIDYATFARLWTSIFDGENVEFDKLLARLPQKKYLLSNTNSLVHERYISECTIIRNHFRCRSDRILSYEVGAIKPNPMIYGVALGKAGTKPEESLFLDDIPENIEAWRALGGVGIVYDAQKDPIEKLETELRALGVLV